MKSHRGMGGLLFILLICGLLLLLGYTVLSYKDQNSGESTSLIDDPQQFKNALITEKRDEQKAEYTVGIFYTLLNFSSFSRYLETSGESSERLCADGKVNRTDPEVIRTVQEILCGPNVQCEGVPYIFRSHSDDRCYAFKNEFAISANVYDENGSLMPLCVDATMRADNTEGVANPTTFRCDFKK